MKYAYLAILSCWIGYASGQITLGSDIIPRAGDTTSYSLLLNVPASIMATSGDDASWDFSSYEAAAGTRAVVYENATSGSGSNDFPNADIVAFEEVGGQPLETYYDTENGEFQDAGFYGGDPIGLGTLISVPYQDALLEFRTPMQFGDTYSDQGATRINFLWDDIPEPVQELVLEAIMLPFGPDSIVIETEFDNVYQVDAWGKAIFSSTQQSDVLRLKVTEQRESNVRAFKFGFGTDITPLLSDVGISFQPMDTVTHYRFFAANHPGPIASFSVNNDTVTNAFIPRRIVTAVKDLYAHTARPGVRVYPNPVTTQATFSFTNLAVGTRYRLQIKNLIGRTVWEASLSHAGAEEYVADLSFLPSGTYLYSLQDINIGRVLATHRLIVLKP